MWHFNWFGLNKRELLLEYFSIRVHQHYRGIWQTISQFSNILNWPKFISCHTKSNSDSSRHCSVRMYLLFLPSSSSIDDDVFQYWRFDCFVTQGGGCHLKLLFHKMCLLCGVNTILTPPPLVFCLTPWRSIESLGRGLCSLLFSFSVNTWLPNTFLCFINKK